MAGSLEKCLFKLKAIMIFIGYYILWFSLFRIRVFIDNVKPEHLDRALVSSTTKPD